MMTGADLKKARRKVGLTQAQLAGALGCSQPYLSLMERGRRDVPAAMKTKLVRTLGMPATQLPVRSPTPRFDAGDWTRSRLGELGYPGFRYVSRRRRPTVNPVSVVLQVLTAERCDPRLLEALPWVLLRFDDLDYKQLVAEAWRHNVQNRLGFVAQLAREAAEAVPGGAQRSSALSKLCEDLEVFRLANEDDLGQKLRSVRFRDHLRDHRGASAAHWNVLTDLEPRYVSHAL